LIAMGKHIFICLVKSRGERVVGWGMGPKTREIVIGLAAEKQVIRLGR
jgi:hypothetical protein